MQGFTDIFGAFPHATEMKKVIVNKQLLKSIVWKLRQFTLTLLYKNFVKATFYKNSVKILTLASYSSTNEASN